MEPKARMFRILSVICILSLLIAGLAATPQKGSAARVVIDSFNDTNSFTVASGTGSKSFSVSSAIGGVRKIRVQVSVGTGITIATTAGTPGDLAYTPVTGSSGNVRIAYDGTAEADNAYTLNKAGISPAVDLTNGGADNMVYMEIPNDDAVVAITMDVYSSASSCSTLVKRLPGAIDPVYNQPLAVVFSFANFAKIGGCTSGANFASVSAVEISFTTPSNLNLNFSLFSGGSADYGDAHIGGGDAYNTQIQTSGTNRYVAGHVIDPALMLGTAIDSEPNGQTSVLPNYPVSVTNAVGDDLHGTADEDGVVRTNMPWTLGDVTGGAVTVNVTGDGCLYGWIDWAMDGIFDNDDTTAGPAGPADRIIDGQAVTDGVASFDFLFPVPSDAPSYVMARFRLYPRDIGGVCDSAGDANNPKYPDAGAASGNGVLVMGGEVEDYYWKIDGTTAADVTDYRASTAKPFGLELLWNTASEADIVGFNLYRTAQGGSEEQVNTQGLITALTPGDASGNAYAFYDTLAVPAVKYTYRLEIVRAGANNADYASIDGWYFNTFIPVIH